MEQGPIPMFNKNQSELEGESSMKSARHYLRIEEVKVDNSFRTESN